jgi:hypothetical protein
MIPLFAAVAVRPNRRSRRRIWIPLPLFLVWLILLPLTPVLLPLFFIACRANRINGPRALGALWQLLGGLGRTRIDVEHPDASILIRVL